MRRFGSSCSLFCAALALAALLLVVAPRLAFAQNNKQWVETASTRRVALVIGERLQRQQPTSPTPTTTRKRWRVP